MKQASAITASVSTSDQKLFVKPTKSSAIDGRPLATVILAAMHFRERSYSTQAASYRLSLERAAFFAASFLGYDSLSTPAELMITGTWNEAQKWAMKELGWLAAQRTYFTSLLTMPALPPKAKPRVMERRSATVYD